MLTPQDRSRIWAWNDTVPPAVERCIHELFGDRARARPDAPAVCAWDGELTYSELDGLSTGLARELIARGVGPEILVPLCFEKSLWTTVAILGVLKAGGAFVLLDPSHPVTRLRGICESVQAQLVLTSALRQEVAAHLGPRVFVLDSRAAAAFDRLTTDWP
ncbi:hypothetical protein KNSL1_013815, partial [Colletotrichum chrysophilum]